MNWFNVFKTEIEEIRKPEKINVGKYTILIVYLNAKDEIVRGFRTLKGSIELENKAYEISTANGQFMFMLEYSIKYGVIELNDGKLIPRERIREISLTKEDLFVIKD